ncbi:MAG: DUF1801 domain-containing protein [Balneolales bacterium]|nr:DUF1801 domain-containing protein [Balneolales bacterium]
MTYSAETVDEYIDSIPEDRKEAITKLREAVLANIPEGFEECINYGMIGYVVPHSIYPDGYHCDPKLPLPFINIASQKNHIAVYHSGVYANEELLNWFTEEYKKQVPTKLDMGKSCIRFKNPRKIPFELIGELAKKVTVQDWIEMYEKNVKN